MHIRKSMSWQAMLVCAGLSWAGLATANTVAVSADPLPNQTLTVTTTAATTTTTTQTFPRGSVLRLQASPTPGYGFVAWGGGYCIGTTQPCTLTLSGDRTVTARFGPLLNVSVTGPGRVSSQPSGINCGADCTEAYSQGTSVMLTAVPDAGQSFTGWGGACSGSGLTCNVSMSAARNVSATFAAATETRYTLGVAVVGGGSVSSTPAGISCGSDCSESYLANTSVSLVATPAAGQVFSGWGGACTGTGACTVSMTQARSVTASFAAAPVSQFTLSVAVTGSGSVSSTPAGISCGSDCSETYANNTSVTLTATPAAGQVFSGWSGACTGTGACMVSMTQARSVTASFSAVVSTGPVYYFSDCQTGAVAGCVPGNNANPGTSPSAPKQTLAGLDVNNLPAGTQLLFARGGAWTNFNVQLRNLNVTATAPLVFDAYGSGPAPWIKAGGMFYAFQFGTFQDTANDGGYTIRNLKLDGLGAAGVWGLHLRNDVHHVLMENLEITGFELAVHTVGATVGNNFILRNSNIHHNHEMGLLGDGYDSVIEGNTFADNNFSGSAFSHAIYLGGHGRNFIVRNNTFTNNSRVNGVCTGGNFTVHGQWDGLLVEGNTIQQDASAGGCYGISVNSAYDSPEWFRNLVVRGNRIVNLGNCSICLTSAPGAIVENNLVVNTQASYHAAILVPDRTPGPGDDVDTGAIVRNNTIYLSQPTAWSEGIALRPGSGTNQQVVSNLIYFGAATDPTHRCYNVGALSNFVAFDNNLCHHAGNNGTFSNVYGTLAAARAAGFDLNGLSSDPLFVALPALSNGWNDQIQAASPATGRGHATRSSARDRLGVTRSVPSMGSREPAR
ncbi:MAG: right-handed parallel beta-helix repeat-containing protein [Burkholderiales bacterium]|nr:right-handed parallel beta-helix repeat-containing protein [Burkholderiales bacterium]